MVIGLCCDHAGFNLKEHIKNMLTAEGYEYKDYGTYSSDSCDYPDFAHKLGEAIENYRHDAEQASESTCRFMLERRDHDSCPRAQRRERACPPRPFHDRGDRETSCQHLFAYEVRGWQASTSYRQDSCNEIISRNLHV